jgi:cytidine deaminase
MANKNRASTSQPPRTPSPRDRVNTSRRRRLWLIAAAAQARLAAVAPYSGFKVGAALLARGGKIFTGANVESASYGLTCCAERVALFGALTRGQRGFTAIAVVARIPQGPMPCGACRQLLAEYAPDAVVCVADSDQLHVVREFSVKALLPAAFLNVPT